MLTTDVESCGINNRRTKGYSSLSLEDPILLPKLKCEKIWTREFERLKPTSKSVVADDSLGKVLCTGNYRKVSYKTYKYSDSTG